MDKREIAQLVEKSRQGDNDAFGKLYQLTEKQAYYIALKIAKNEDDALDILQDSYIKAMQKMDTLENPENFVAWFNQIVANSTKNFVVKNKPMLFRDDEDEAAVMDFQADDSLDAKPDDSLDTDETRAFIRELVDELPEDKRMCVLMFYFQNMGTAEIAKALGISEGTVKTRLYHSRDKIKQSIEALEKKGIKVRGIAPIPFFVWMLKRMAEGTQVSKGAAAGIIKAATSSAAAGATAAGAATTAATGAATAASTAAATAATTTGAVVATGITAKVVAIVAAGAVVVGGGAVGAKVIHDKRVEQATTAVAEESTEFVSQNIAAAATENESGTEITVEFDGSTMIVSNENGTTVITVTPGTTVPGTTGKAGVTTTGGNTQPSTNAPTTAQETTTAKQTTTVKPTEKSTTAPTQTADENDGVIISGSGGSGSSTKPQTTTTITTTTTTTTQAPTTTEATTVGTATMVIDVYDIDWNFIKTIDNIKVDAGSYITASTIKSEVLKYTSEYGDKYTGLITIEEGEIISSAPGVQSGNTYYYKAMVS